MRPGMEEPSAPQIRLLSQLQSSVCVLRIHTRLNLGRKIVQRRHFIENIPIYPLIADFFHGHNFYFCFFLLTLKAIEKALHTEDLWWLLSHWVRPPGPLSCVAPRAQHGPATGWGQLFLNTLGSWQGTRRDRQAALMLRESVGSLTLVSWPLKDLPCPGQLSSQIWPSVRWSDENSAWASTTPSPTPEKGVQSPGSPNHGSLPSSQLSDAHVWKQAGST